MAPTKEEIGRVYEWYFDRRDKWAEKLECEPNAVPTMVPWIMDPDWRPTDEDMAEAHRVAKELGF